MRRESTEGATKNVLVTNREVECMRIDKEYASETMNGFQLFPTCISINNISGELKGFFTN